MSVEAQTVQYDYLGDGTTTRFEFPARFLRSTDLLVGVAGAALSPGQYSVVGAGNDNGGYIETSTPPVAGARVQLLRRPPASQLQDYQNGQTVFEGTLEDGLDKLTMIAQYLLRGQDRSVRVSEFDTVSAGELLMPSRESRANRVLGFDGTGAVVTVPLSGFAVGVGTYDFPTQTVMGFAVIGETQKIARCGGFSVEGDGGHVQLKRVNAQPTHGGRLRSADRFRADGVTDAANGGWWEFIDTAIDPRAFGVIYNNAADQSAQAQGWLDYLSQRNALGYMLGLVRATGLVVSAGAVRIMAVPGGGFVTSVANTTTLTLGGEIGSKIDGLTFIKPVGDASGAAVRLTSPVVNTFGTYGSRVTNCEFTGGYNAVNSSDNYSAVISDNTISQVTGSGVVFANARTANSGRSHIARNHITGAGAFGARTALYGVLVSSGNETWVTDNWVLGFNVMVGFVLPLSQALFNTRIAGNYGADLNLGIYIDSTSGTPPMGVPASLSNVIIAGNNIQALQCIITSGLITNGQIYGNSLFPYVNGIGMNVMLNGFSVGTNHIDATPLGGGNGVNTTGVLLQAGSFQTVFTGTVFSGVAGPWNLTTPDVTVSIYNSYYLGDSGAPTNIAPLASGSALPGSPFERTIYVYANSAPATFSLSINGVTITGSIVGGSYSVKLRPWDVLNYFYNSGTITIREQLG